MSLHSRLVIATTAADSHPELRKRALLQWDGVTDPRQWTFKDQGNGPPSAWDAESMQPLASACAIIYRAQPPLLDQQSSMTMDGKRGGGRSSRADQSDLGSMRILPPPSGTTAEWATT